MPKPKDISINEKEFILSLLQNDQKRVDDRGFEEFRNVNIQFGSSLGNVEVSLGDTRLIVQVSAEAVKPYEDRPYEGMFLITTDISSMASPLFENNRQSNEEAMVTRLIEKAIRRSHALDLEALVIEAGKLCWMIRADVHYLNYDGGLVDATCIGVITALLHFKMPDMTFDNDGKLIIHPIDERPPVPLSILHVPICVTFSFFKYQQDADADNAVKRDICIVDATGKEEALRHSELTITINTNRDICQISKPGGVMTEAVAVMRCANRAFEIATELTALIHRRLKEDDSIRNKGNLKVILSAENRR
jgi:exosome complex component RRP45